MDMQITQKVNGKCYWETLTNVAGWVTQNSYVGVPQHVTFEHLSGTCDLSANSIQFNYQFNYQLTYVCSIVNNE